jgi:hypothetical protein
VIVSWGILTIGAAPVQVPTASTSTRGSKLSFQVGPGSTGRVKIGGAGLTSDLTTPGAFLDSSPALNGDGSAQPGDVWVVETGLDQNTIYPRNYFVHGTNAGDLVFWEFHQVL